MLTKGFGKVCIIAFNITLRTFYQKEKTDPLLLIYYPCMLDSADNWQTGDYSSCFIVYLADKKLPKGDFTIEVHSGDLCHKQVKYLGSI